MKGEGRAGDLRLADLLAALSVTTDLAMGQAPEKAIRSCLVATELARALGLPDPDISEVYYVTLLRHLGCTATSHEESYLFGGDELLSRPQAERTDFGNVREMASFMAAIGRGTGPSRLRYLARAMTAGKETNKGILRAVCEVGAHLSERIGLGPGVREALYQSLERWDGKGDPHGLAGEAIALPARIAEPAIQAVIFDRLAGPEAVVEMARRRAGGWFDPGVAEALQRIAPQLLPRLAEADAWTAVLDAEPDPARRIPEAGIDRVAEAFGDMVDLKTPFTLGHSSGVADLAARAGGALGLPEEELTALRRAALFHDIGRVGVSNGVWEKAGPLTASEWEAVRLHPYHTERILSRSAALDPLARLAGMHHERQDGSGYHHGASGPEVPPASRVLAATDAYQAMTQDRPHRTALPDETAAETLTVEAKEGHLDPECVRAVLEAAGQRPRRVRTAWPAGLSDREVEVLRLVARGLSNKQVAKRLYISPRTAEHHVQHIYSKIGASTRASAAMFAMEQGLLRD